MLGEISLTTFYAIYNRLHNAGGNLSGKFLWNVHSAAGFLRPVAILLAIFPNIIWTAHAKTDKKTNEKKQQTQPNKPERDIRLGEFMFNSTHGPGNPGRESSRTFQKRRPRTAGPTVKWIEQKIKPERGLRFGEFIYNPMTGRAPRSTTQ